MNNNSGDNMHKRKNFKKEVIVLSLLLFLIAIAVRAGGRLIETAFNRVAFPANESIFENLKVYFTAVTVLIIGEYFARFDYPNNYLLSRIAGAVVMMAMTAVVLGVYYFFARKNINTAFIYLIYIISIFTGQYISFLFHQIKELRLGVLLGLFQYLLTGSIIIIVTTAAPVGFLFQTW